MWQSRRSEKSRERSHVRKITPRTASPRVTTRAPIFFACSQSAALLTLASRTIVATSVPFLLRMLSTDMASSNRSRSSPASMAWPQLVANQHSILFFMATYCQRGPAYARRAIASLTVEAHQRARFVEDVPERDPAVNHVANQALVDAATGGEASRCRMSTSSVCAGEPRSLKASIGFASVSRLSRVSRRIR